MRASLGCVGIPVLAAASLIGLMNVFSSAMASVRLRCAPSCLVGDLGVETSSVMSEGFFVPIEELSYLLDHIDVQCGFGLTRI